MFYDEQSAFSRSPTCQSLLRTSSVPGNMGSSRKMNRAQTSPREAPSPVAETDTEKDKQKLVWSIIQFKNYLLSTYCVVDSCWALGIQRYVKSSFPGLEEVPD